MGNPREDRPPAGPDNRGTHLPGGVPRGALSPPAGRPPLALDSDQGTPPRLPGSSGIRQVLEILTTPTASLDHSRRPSASITKQISQAQARALGSSDLAARFGSASTPPPSVPFYRDSGAVPYANRAAILIIHWGTTRRASSRAPTGILFGARLWRMCVIGPPSWRLRCPPRHLSTMVTGIVRGSSRRRGKGAMH